MTVSTQVSRNEYTGNGATTQYDFTFRILDKSHLLVQTLDTSESIVTLILGTDYTVTGVNRYNGGKVVLTSALPAGYKISIERSTPVTQESSIRNQGGFFPEIHEDALDKLTMLVQQAYGWWSGLSLRKPSWLANYYDALNNRIRNLRDPSQAQDAATKNYVDWQIVDNTNAWKAGDAILDQKIDNNFSRTLRVPESNVDLVPSAVARKNSIFGWNNDGNPVPIFSYTETADLALKLASTADGLGTSLSGYKRKKLLQYIDTAQKALDSQSVSVLEFANLITYKPTSDPQTWDWAPAFQALADYCLSYVSQTAVNATMYGAKDAIMPPGVYPIYGTINITKYGNSTGSLQSVFKLKGAGRTSSIIQPMTAGMTGLVATNCAVIFEDCGMRAGSTGQIPYQLGLRDTWAPVAHAVFDRFGTSGFTCGGLIYLCFDSTFKDCFWQNIQAAADLSGSFGIRVATYEGPANGGTTGDGSGDDTNQLLFIRPTVETTGDDSILLSVEGKNSSFPHHAVTLIGGHFETHNLKSKLLHMKNVYHFQAYGTVFSQNGSSTGISEMYRLGYFENVQNITIDRCRMVTTNRLASYSASDTKMIAVVGTCQNLVFDRTHFIGPYNDINAGKHRADYLIDYSGANKGKRSFVLNSCTFGDYLSRPITTILRISDLSGVNDYRCDVDETTGNVSIYYSTNFTDSAVGTPLWQLTPVGVVKTAANLQIGALSTAGATRGLDFVNNGDGSTVTAFIRADSVGRINFNAYGLTHQWVLGASSFNPSVTAVSTIGTSSLYPANIYSQNAVTVISDINYKTAVRKLSDHEGHEALIAAVGSIPFSIWKLKSALEQKGELARWHAGVIAQQVRDALISAGLDWTKYGLITYEKHEQLVVVGADGNYYPYPNDDASFDSDISVNELGCIDFIDGADSVIDNGDGTAMYYREVYMMRMEEFISLRIAYIESRMEL